MQNNIADMNFVLCVAASQRSQLRSLVFIPVLSGRTSTNVASTTHPSSHLYSLIWLFTLPSPASPALSHHSHIAFSQIQFLLVMVSILP